MVATTLRGYPYYQAPDPAELHTATQALAAGIDADITASLVYRCVSTFEGGPASQTMAYQNTTVGAANRGLLALVVPQQTITPTSIRWWCAVQNGNYDVGIYRKSTLARLWSKGTTACPAAGVVTNAVAAVTLTAGIEYYLALAFDNNTAEFYGAPLSVAGMGDLYDGTIGVGYRAAVMPLPNPIGALTTGTVVPLIQLRG